MELELQKQPRKYLASVGSPTRKKLEKALEDLKELKGDIVYLQGTKNPKKYRLKIDHYRIVFSYDDGEIITVEEIDTRGNIKYRRFM